MIHRFVFAIALASAALCQCMQPAAIVAQARPAAAATGEVPRAIRRDVPLTNAIRRAYEAGTRDRIGRPGPNYWQLQTDYDIAARLDPATQTITGTETITLHNNSPQEMTEILLPGAEGDERLYESLELQAPLAVGLRVVHEQRARAA
jgi:hypothetical protein